MHLLLFLPLVGLVLGECPHRVKRQDGFFRSYYNQFPSGFATLSIGGKKTPEPKYAPIAAPIYPAYEPEVEYPAQGCAKLYGQPTKCRPAGECAVWFQDIIGYDGSTCELEKGVTGLCCPGTPKNGKPPLFKRQNKKVQLRTPIDIYDLNAAAEEGQVQMKLLGETEKLLLKKGIQVQRNTPAFGHLLFFQTSSEAIGFSRSALLGVESTEALSRRFGMTPEEAGFGLAGFSLRDTVISDACFADEPCDESAFFRTHDGSCNNLRIGNLGKSKTPFQRILPAQYADGVWLPRVAKSGIPLPSARLVSISVVPDVDSPHYGQSLWTMQWGQFVDHDLTSTPVFRIETNGTGIICCGSDGKDLPSPVLVHPECFSIEIPEDDPFFARHGQRCMSFVRSMPAPRLDCSFGHGEQMNQLTHYLDGSNVYGSTQEEADGLRTFREGTLKVAPRDGFPPVVGGDLLPPDSEPEMSCSPPNATREIPCFKAGDSRSNEQPDLAVTHTIFLREHNRVATELGHLNPHWDDERIYQETRRIVIAELQHITYNEWLEPILGRQAMEAYGLLPLQYGFSKDYSEDVNPTMMNEFASAAFRFGHTLVQGHVELINQKKKVETTLLLRQHFFKSEVVYTPGNLDKFLIGLANQPQQDFDNYVSEELTNHLFQEPDMEFGMDLVSLNIQRGRDHGLPGYNSYRDICGLPRARHFDDLLDVIPHPIVERFKLLYRDVDDIDLFIAGISERPAEGALLGPTFQCIIGDQFSRLKIGDRYFYELGGMDHSFTEAQLNEIRKITLARVVCDNSEVETTQPLLFWTPSYFNEPVSCKGYSIPRIDLYPWKEDPHSSNYKPKYSQYQKRPSHKPSKPKIPYEQSQYKAEYYGPYKPEHYETYRTRPEYYKPEIYSFEQRIPNKYHEREYRGNRRY